MSDTAGMDSQTVESPMPDDVTLLYNNPDPEGGGISRYASVLIRGLESEGIRFEEVDFTPISSDNVIGKIRNLLRRRRKVLENNREKLSGVNLFLQPELFWPTRGVDVVTVHDLFLKDFSGGSLYERVRAAIYAHRFEKSLRHADHLIAVSSLTEQRLIEDGVAADDVSTINLGVRDKFHLANDWTTRSPTVGYIGDFRPRKRVGKLLEDFVEHEEQLDPYRLVLAGSGGNREPELRETYGGRDRIRFQGKIPERRIVDWYNSLQFLFFPTQYEGFGLPILEATACGTPVFVYEDAEIPDEIRRYCYDVDSIPDVLPRVRELTDGELERRASTVKEEFDWDDTVSDTIRVLEEHA